VRLIQNYLKLDKLDNAVYYFQYLKRTFDEKTVNKHKAILDSLQSDNKQFSDYLEKMKINNSKSGNKANWMIYLLILGILIYGLFYYYKNYYSASAVGFSKDNQNEFSEVNNNVLSDEYRADF